MNILLSPVVFILLIALMGAPGFGLYVIFGAGWAAWLRYQGSPWLVIEALLWPTSVYIAHFDRSK